jgi:DNA-binding GntR family transcriptional regulator
VYPTAQPRQFDYQRVYDFYRARILSGELSTGDQLPALRDIAREAQVSQGSAQRAIELLASSRLVRIVPRQGAFVADPRDAHGPQERIRATQYPGAERIEVRAAELIAVPDYIRPILGLGPATSHVMRREWRTADSTGPFMLSVAWIPPQLGILVPSLLELAPLPDPRGEAVMLAEAAGLEVTWGTSSREARQVRDDGREAEALGLPGDGHVLAETYKWGSDDAVLVYVEFIVRENRVIVTELLP